MLVVEILRRVDGRRETEHETRIGLSESLPFLDDQLQNTDHPVKGNGTVAAKHQLLYGMTGDLRKVRKNALKCDIELTYRIISNAYKHTHSFGVSDSALSSGVSIVNFSRS